ncbi:MAG: FxLYD domain-containing protein [Patescibacteria group bacterium]
MSRNKKRIVAVGFYIGLLIIIGFGIHSLLTPNPTCNDGIKNQLEEGVDCGGPCPPCPEEEKISELEVVDKEWNNTESNKFDAVVKMKNPNSSLGVAEVQLKATFLDEENEILREVPDIKSFILPDEEKSVLLQNIELPGSPDNLKIEITKTDWKKFSDYSSPKLPIIRTSFEDSSEGVAGNSRVIGTLINESNTDYETIKVQAILRNREGELLAVNSQVMNTVRAGEERDFKMVFSSAYNLSEVFDVDVKAETNIFNSYNYIKIHGNPENIHDR